MSVHKKKLILIFMAIFVLFSSDSYAWNEPDSFMGLKFWRPITEGTLPECPLRTPFTLDLPEAPVAKNPPSAPEPPATSLKTPQRHQPSETETALSRSRQKVLDSITQTRNMARSEAEKNVAKHQEERQKAQEEYERRRDLYYQGKASRAEVTEAESALTAAMLRVDEDTRILAEAKSEPAGEFRHYDDIKTWELKKPCWQEIGRDGNSHEIKNVTIGGFILDVKAESLERKLAHIFIVFPQGDYGQILLTFKERYGAPTSARTETVQSRIGAKFKNEIFKWEGKRVTITLDKMGWTVDKGTVSYDTDIWRAHSARKFQEDIKKKAKGL